MDSQLQAHSGRERSIEKKNIWYVTSSSCQFSKLLTMTSMKFVYVNLLLFITGINSGASTLKTSTQTFLEYFVIKSSWPFRLIYYLLLFMNLLYRTFEVDLPLLTMTLKSLFTFIIGLFIVLRSWDSVILIVKLLSMSSVCCLFLQSCFL